MVSDEEFTLKLIRAISRREGTVKQLAERFGLAPSAIRTFAETHADKIRQFAEQEKAPKSTQVTPEQLDDLWITNKFERLKRLQAVADDTYASIIHGATMSPAEQATVIREFRAYLMLAANELGQLLHRGSGDAGTGDTLSVNIAGVDMDTLR